MTPIELLDLAAVFIFALTGGLVASRAQLDPVGFVFIAILTAVGGGTVRDVLLDRNPIFWIASPHILAAAVAAAALTYVAAPMLESRMRVIIWLDAAALAVAVPAGTGVAINLGSSWPIVLLMGVATGCFGGLMRDVVCNEVPLVLKQGELYITAAFAGAAAALLAVSADLPLQLSLLICAAATFCLRAGSIAFGWSLPAYKHEPPKS